ncbi:putative Ig domain-containing protein [Pleionea litopenaei]|uniref:Ig domain-containing protein n=1 Tax=Pleionea litopenaei TaxID=3070815 RepID=A0AA51RX23_9GAMM|nr:putative Ig domain-containing protein [Pleionea sp. HL-JVS1]WMS89223.1 putative Ig domain-containing protein [Pleionea sp. HL-JVS1]
MDTVYLVDGSSSMTQVWPLLSGHYTESDIELIDNGIGSGETKNRYGLVGFGYAATIVNFEQGIWSDFSGLYNEMYIPDGPPGGSGIGENGLLAIQTAIDNYPFRENVAKTVTLFADEETNAGLTNGETIAELRQRYIDNNIVLNVITNYTPYCADGRVAIGANSEDIAFVATEEGGFEFCEFDRERSLELGSPAIDLYVEPFVKTAFATGGSAFSMSAYYFSGDFESVLAAYNYQLIKQASVVASGPQADLSFAEAQLQYTDNQWQLSVVVNNRGLAVSDVASLEVSGAANAVIDVNGILPEQSETLFIPLGQERLSGNLQLQINAGTNECLANNNQVTLPVISLLADDGEGGTATQTFNLNVGSNERIHEIISVPPTSLSLGLDLVYQVELSNTQKGDHYQYSLVGPESASIDSFAGLLRFKPTSEQIGNQDFTITVTNLAGEQVQQFFSVQVTNDYTLPRFTDETFQQRVTSNTSFEFQPTVISDSTAQLTYSLVHSPSSSSIDPQTGAFIYNAQDSDIDVIRLVNMKVTDQYGNSDYFIFSVFADYLNVAPSIIDSGEDLATIGPDGYQNIFSITDPNVRENFDLSITTSADFLSGQIYDYYGTDMLQGILAWSGEDAYSLHPLHGIDNNFLCSSSDNLVASSYAPLKLKNRFSIGGWISPLVMPLSDTNEDGVVDLRDDKGLIVHTSNTIRGISLDNQIEHWIMQFGASGLSLPPSRLHGMAAADINADGVLDVLYVVSGSSRTLVARSSDDGRLLWESAVGISNRTISYGDITIVDANNDGFVEITAGDSVFSHEGDLLLTFDAVNYSASRYSPIYTLDVNGDGIQDFIQKGIAKDLNGNEIGRVDYQRREGSKEAYMAFANFDNDPALEMVIVENIDSNVHIRTMALVDDDFSFIWGPTPIRNIGPVFVGDFTGDSNAEIFVSSADTLFDANGEIIWQLDDWSNYDGRLASVADIQGDGRLDVIIHRELFTFLIDGLTGEELNRKNAGNASTMAPVVIDSDGNQKLEIFTTTRGLLTIQEYDGVTLQQGLPQYYNQSIFSSDALQENLQVQQGQIVKADNSFGSVHVKSKRFTNGIADLWVGRPISRTRGEIVVDVKNKGTANYPYSFKVLLVKGDPDNGGEVIATQSSHSLSIGESQQLVFRGLDLEDYNGEVTAVIQALSIYEECSLDNNYTSSHTVEYTISDNAGESNSVYYLLGVQYLRSATPTILTPSELELTEGVEYKYGIDVLTDRSVDPLNFGSFQVHQGPDGLTINSKTGELSWTPELGQAGSYEVQVQRINFVNSSSRVFTLTVAPSPNSPPEITSVPNVGTAEIDTFIYQVEATDPDGDAITYRLLDGPTTMSIGAQSGYIEWIADQEGSITVSIEASDGQFTDVQTFTMDVTLSNSSPEITSTPSSQATANKVYQYSILATDAEGDAITFSLVSGPQAMTVDSTSGELRWAVSSSDVGLHDVVIAATDEHGFSSNQSFSVNVSSGLVNTAPMITSTPTGVVAPDQQYTYSFIAVDAENHALTYSLENAPTGMAISAQGLVQWTPSLSDVGTYNIVIKVEDELGAYAIQSYSLIVAVDGQSNDLPTISSTPFSFAQTNALYTYSVVASDPNGDALSYSLVTAPAGMSINGNDVSWTPTEVGSVSVQLRVSDGQNYVDQFWTINVSDEPVEFSALLSLAPRVAEPNEMINLAVQPQYARGEVTGSVSFNGNNYPLDAQLAAQFSGVNPGAYVVEVSLNDGSTNLVLTETVYIRDAADTQAPVVNIESPLDADVITRLQDVVISVSDDRLANWRLVLKARNTAPTDYQVIAEGNSNVSSQTVAQIDATMMLNGFYSLILQATDENGAESSVTTVVSVEEQLKLGVYTITLEDVNLPVAGIPIQVTRTYDSRRRNETLDFGKGWSIDYQNVRVQENQTLGFAWALNEYSSGYFSRWCVEPVSNPMVTVRLPDGDVEKFRAVADPGCTQFVPETNVRLAFEPIGATFSTLEQDTYSLLKLVNGHLVRAGDNGQVDPALYTLTTKEGMKYKLDQNFGVIKVIEPNGHSLTYSDNGITHSLNTDVDFVRNEQGLIEQIILPDDSVINYQYNSELELTRVEYPSGVSNEYTYLADHYLEELIDGQGRVVSRNEYDTDGRLIATYDAFGNKIEMIHNLADNVETVLDRNLNPTTYVFDDKGRVLSETNALNETTTRTYNEHGLMLSETNALNETTTWTYDDRANTLTETDPTGYVTNYVYDNTNQLIRMYDSTGKTLAENRYDIGRNLTELTRADGTSVSMLYDVGIGSNQTGQLLFMTDAEGNSTEYHVHFFTGQTVGQTDASGVRTDYTLDDNLNRTSESTTRTLADGTVETLVTTYEYDSGNRLVSTLYPDGTSSRVEYDENGREKTVYDEQDRATVMDYNDRGELISTTYPDGSTSEATYDANGNKLTETNRLGQVTTYTYDALNRVLTTTNADNRVTTNEYDEAGRLTAMIDARGFRTEYEYDSAGRRTKVIDAFNNEHSFAYDEEGNLVSETDALGHTTTYEYDLLNRRTATVFHNLSRVATEFDKADRQVAKLDQAQVRTEYEYDPLGRLVKVIDVLGNETSYTYDEQGNKLTQTDAEGRTTRWTYDSMGRVLTRQLPMGQTETSQYDSFGRLESHTDFNGDAKTFIYDVNDRITQISYADGSTESFTYDAIGNRLSATDASGTTVYTYDALSRLETETKPTGEVLSYEYDENGNKTRFTITYIGGAVREETFTYDRLNRLETVTDNNGNVTTYGYDAVGNRSSISYPNGSSQVYVYDELNRLTTLRHFDSNGALINEFNYTLHTTGRRTQIDELSGRSVINGYDELYRLTSETIVDPINGDYSASYTYDNVGNRTYSTINGVSTSFSYDNNDRITVQGDITYEYDDNGNTLFKGNLEEQTFYRYSLKNKLTQVESAEGINDYEYDVDNNRVEKTEAGTAVRFIVDNNQAYAQVIAEASDTNVIGKEYVYGDDLISQSANAASHYYMYDGLGSTRSLTDDSGSISDQYFYDAFGITLASVGSTDNNYLYTGEQYDSGLDNYYLRARYYDQNVGRFTQMDTWMGHNHDPVTLHKYLYANADPISYTDPSGHFSLGSLNAATSIRGILSTVAQSTMRVSTGVVGAGRASVSFVARYMGRLAVNVLRPVFRAAGRLSLQNARGRSLTSFDKFKRFFMSPTRSHPNVNWGPIGRFLKKAFPNVRWEQHHVAIQARWFRPGGPSQWYPHDRLANLGLQRLGNAGFNLMAIPRGLNGALGRSAWGTAGLAIGSYGTVAYGIYEIISSLGDD